MNGVKPSYSRGGKCDGGMDNEKKSRGRKKIKDGEERRIEEEESKGEEVKRGERRRG
jgi:hypothetical protein